MLLRVYNRTKKPRSAIKNFTRSCSKMYTIIRPNQVHAVQTRGDVVVLSLVRATVLRQANVGMHRRNARPTTGGTMTSRCGPSFRAPLFTPPTFS